MKYSFQNNDGNEALSVRKLIKICERYAETKVIYLDVVSVEKTINRPYLIKWFGPNRDFLIKYLNLISRYLSSNNTKNKSLLFLNPSQPKKHDIFESRVIHFNISTDTSQYGKVNDKEYLQSLFYNNQDNFISEQEEHSHITNWENEILVKMGIPYALFSKIDFSISGRNFVTAIWIGFESDAKENLQDRLFFSIIKSFLWSYSSKEIANNLINEALQYATQTAVSEIINRNMAHHIISHISHRATLDKILERLGYQEDTAKANFLSNKENYLAVLDLLNRFNQYRDERGEYLTYITNFSSPCNAMFFQNVIRPFIENSLLMDNIAANENLHFEKDDNGELTKNKLTLKIKIKNENGDYQSFYGIYKDASGTKLFCSENIPYLPNKSIDKVDVIDGLNDFEVSLPGTLGKHALYSILENFIRNSSKHGSDIKNKDGLDIILLIEENKKEDCFEVLLTDNCSYVKDDNGNELINIEGFNKSIKTPILEKIDLGLIDMKVNACLLEGKELTDENCKNALKARDPDAPEYKNRLAYKFKIAKPKKAVFIGDFVKKEENSKGFFFYKTAETFQNAPISKSFEFAVLGKEVDKSKIQHELPIRTLKYCAEKHEKFNDLSSIYKEWLEQIRGNQKANIHLYLQQGVNEYPTKDFLDKFKEHNNFKIYNKNIDGNIELNGNSVTDIAEDKNIFYDRHGEMINSLSSNNNLVDSNQSWILIDKNNPDFDYINQYNIERNDNLLPYELEEAGLLKVLIIDERVAEQSIRKIDDTNLLKINKSKFGFTKFDTSPNITLFDTAWASNVFIATHLNGTTLKVDIDENCQHKLDVNINFKLLFKTNITSRYGTLNGGGMGVKKYWDFNEQTYKSTDEPKSISLNLNPDVTIIHRTILKKLLGDGESSMPLDKLNELFPNLIVTTGSGSTHGIDGDFKILPFNTLSELVCGKRIQKLRLSKLLLTLTKNKV